MKAAAALSRRDQIRTQLADLKMPGALEALDEVLTTVDGGGVTASEAIEELLGAQITLRNNRRLQAAMRSSRLPAIKTLSDFDFSFQPSVKREQIDSLHELGFLERKENVIFLGPPGVGKTHLAISLAIAAAQSGRRVYYGALADLITSLEEAKTAGQLGRRLKILTYPSLLVIDEIGYLPVSQTGAMLFFQLINRRYERASTVLTSNKGFEEWGQILGDEVMAAALIDRLLHHCHIVNIRGSSYRMRKHIDLSKILHSPPAEPSPLPPREREQEQRRSRRTRGSSPPPGVTFSPGVDIRDTPHSPRGAEPVRTRLAGYMMGEVMGGEPRFWGFVGLKPLLMVPGRQSECGGSVRFSTSTPPLRPPPTGYSVPILGSTLSLLQMWGGQRRAGLWPPPLFPQATTSRPRSRTGRGF